MEKVRKFKQLCSEMEQRKKCLNEEVDIYVSVANEVSKYGAFVSSENKIIDPNNSIPKNLKDKYETTFSQIYKHIQQQSQWIKDINQAYKEANDEILEYVQQLSKYPDLVNYIKQGMEIQARVNRLASIEYGEQKIKELQINI